MKTKQLLIIIATLLTLVSIIGCSGIDEPADDWQLKDAELHLNVTGEPLRNYTVIYGWQTADGNQRTVSYIRNGTYDTIFKLSTESEITYLQLTVQMFDDVYTLTGSLDVYFNNEFQKTVTETENQINYHYGNYIR